MYKVLIVDDEPKVSQLIKTLVDWQRLDLELIAIAHDGINAFELIKRLKPDICITDIRMPGYDGIELIKYSKEFNPNIDFILISGYQHFDYAYNAIKYGVKDYFLKPLKKDELNATLLKIIKQQNEKNKLEKNYQDNILKLKEQILSNLYFEKDDTLSMVTNLMELDDVTFNKECYQALVFKLDFDFDESNNELIAVLAEKLSSIITNNFTSVQIEFANAILDNCIFGIANYSIESKKTFRKTLNNIINESLILGDANMNIALSIGLGSIQTSLECISLSIREAKLALKDRLVTGEAVNYYNFKYHSFDMRPSIITQDRRNRLLYLLEAFDVNELRKWLENVENEILLLPDISGQYVLDTISEICEVLQFYVSSFTKASNVAEFLLSELIVAVNVQKNIKGIFSIVRKYTSGIVQHLSAEHESELSRPIREAKKYINDNFSSDIDLYKVSSIVGYNPTYFSLLFKKETGTNFLEYLTNVRIKGAKQLLKDSSNTVLSICNEVGYSDVGHFTKLFKKTTGLTPVEYRKFHH